MFSYDLCSCEPACVFERVLVRLCACACVCIQPAMSISVRFTYTSIRMSTYVCLAIRSYARRDSLICTPGIERTYKYLTWQDGSYESAWREVLEQQQDEYTFFADNPYIGGLHM